MAVSFYILVGLIKPNQRSNEAAVKYFLLGAFSLGVLLYGMSLMYGLSGTTSLRAMAPMFAGQEHDPRLILAVILVVAGVGFKIAAVPFHMWAPDSTKARRRRSRRFCPSDRRRRRSRCCCGSSSRVCPR